MHSQHTSRPALPNVAVVCLSVAVVTGTVLAGAVVAGVFTPYRPNQGVGSTLSAITAISGCGFIVSVATDRVMRRLDQLEASARSRQVVYLPAPRPTGHLYASSPAIDQDALREEVERVVAEELGAREAVRAQGYAEGYVDGIDRRGGGGDVSAN